MSQTDIKPQDGTIPESEVIEDTTEGETVETPAIEEDEEVAEDTVPRSQLNQVLARAKKAENDLRTLRGNKIEPAKTITQPLSDDAVDARILKAGGMSDELLSELKVIAKLRGKPMLDCQTDPIFIALKEVKDKESRKTSLPASRGSSSVKKSKDFKSGGLTDAEHKSMWREQNGL